MYNLFLLIIYNFFFVIMFHYTPSGYKVR